LVITGSGTGLKQSVTVTDRAGNTATFTTPSFNIDRSAPIIQSSSNGLAGDNGWYRGDVQVTWTVTDPDSTVSSSTGCGAATVNADTAGTTFTCTATSGGGTYSSSITVKRDATAPLLTFGSPYPAPNAAIAVTINRISTGPISRFQCGWRCSTTRSSPASTFSG
jgi:hypothetical protein